MSKFAKLEGQETVVESVLAEDSSYEISLEGLSLEDLRKKGFEIIKFILTNISDFIKWCKEKIKDLYDKISGLAPNIKLTVEVYSASIGNNKFDKVLAEFSKAMAATVSMHSLFIKNPYGDMVDNIIADYEKIEGEIKKIKDEGPYKIPNINIKSKLADTKKYIDELNKSQKAIDEIGDLFLEKSFQQIQFQRLLRITNLERVCINAFIEMLTHDLNAYTRAVNKG